MGEERGEGSGGGELVGLDTAVAQGAGGPVGATVLDTLNGACPRKREPAFRQVVSTPDLTKHPAKQLVCPHPTSKKITTQELQSR